MTKIKCPRCKDSFQAVASEEVRYCPICEEDVRGAGEGTGGGGIMLTTKERAIEIVEGSMFDSYKRAKMALTHLAKDRMREEKSQQIRDGYRKEQAEILEVIKWLEGIPC